MTTWPSHWPTEARAVARTITAAIDAVRRDDGRLIAATTTELASLPHGAALDLQAAVLRTVLERTHPDGLTAEHVDHLVEDVLISCALRDADPSAQPQVEVDRLLLTVVLLGALGIDLDPAGVTGEHAEAGDADEGGAEEGAALPHYSDDEKIMAATLLLTALLERLQAEPGQFVIMAMTDIERAQQVEMP